MNKLELVAALCKEADITKPEAKMAVEIFFDSMTDAMVADDRVEIRGLCSFYVKKY